MNCHLEVTSLEEDFNNQAARTTCCVGCQSASPLSHSCYQPTGSRRKRPCGRWGWHTGSGTQTPYRGRHPVITTECLVCQPQRPTGSPAWHRPPGRSAALVAGAPLCGEGGSVPFLLEQVLTPGVDSPSLHAVLLPRLPRAGLRNAFFTVLVAHAAPLPIKEPPSQQKKRGSGHTAVEVAGRTVFPTTPHRPGWRNGGMTFRRRAYNATWVAIVSGLWKPLPKAPVF